MATANIGRVYCLPPRILVFGQRRILPNIVCSAPKIYSIFKRTQRIIFDKCKICIFNSTEDTRFTFIRHFCQCYTVNVTPVILLYLSGSLDFIV